jgi:hypothetical protein
MNIDDEDKKGEIQTIEENDDDQDEKQAPAAPQADAAEDADDERLSADQRQDDDGDNETDEEREAKRERRRQERAAKKANVYADRLELNALRAQNAALAERLASLETGQIGQSAHLIDQRLNEAVYRARQAEDALAKAIETGNGEIARDAIRLRDRAMNEAQQLNAYKQSLVAQAQRPREQQMDPIVQKRASDFIQKNRDWYDMQGNNEDSAIMLAIDDRLAKDGFDPSSSEYWDELEKRAAKRLPHRFKPQVREEAPQKRPGGPPVAGRGSNSPGTRQIYVSPERRAAMMEAGVWDDPKLRKDALRRYAEYDRTNSVR